MGLDAVVFKSTNRLRKEYSREFEIVDAETGEAAAVDDRDLLSLDQSVAAAARLGNVDEVADLSEAVLSALGKESFIAEKVLYSATHSGDCIPTHQLRLLRDELCQLKKIDDQHVAKFISAMDALLDVAEKENNPVVFV